MATGSPFAVPAALAGGVLIDSDHLLDFYYWYVKKDAERVFVLFHAWEYAALGLALTGLVWYHPILLAVVLGHVGHLVGDQINNRPTHPLAYSVIYRLYRGFARHGMFRESPANLSEALRKSIPMWHIVEPMLLKVAFRLRKEGR